jgi:hypothetical protein
MASKHRLRTPELDVLMHDGASFTVQCFNVDLVAWDRERGRHGWGTAQDVPFQWMNFLAWHALCKRPDHELPAMTLDDFTVACRQVISTDASAEDDGPAVDPTNLGLADG